MKQTVTSALGALLLLAGLAIIVVFGNVLDRLGGAEQLPLNPFDIGGALMAVLGLAMSATVFFHGTGRAARAWLNLALYSILVFASLILICMIAENRSFRWDATAHKYYSLSPQTAQFLHGLKSRVEITAFHVPGEGPDKRQILGVLDLYGAASPWIEVNVLNPVSQPLRARQYAEDVKPGDTFVRLADSPASDSRRMSRIRGIDEENLTNAIVNVLQGERTTVFFLEGHGEKSLESGVDFRPVDSVSRLAQFLKERGFPVVPLNLLQGGEALPDPKTSIVFCAGPRADLKAPEREMLEALLDAGGKAVFMLDPLLEESPAGGLAEFPRLLDKYGIEIRGDIVYDPYARRQFGERLSFPVVIARYGAHSIAENMSRYTTVMSQARAVRRSHFTSPDLNVVEFLFSSPKTSYDIDLREALAKGADWQALLKNMTPGELPLAAAAELRRSGQPEEQATKVVVFGDSDVFTDQIWGRSRVPATLTANTVNWLSATENRIAIPPRRPELTPLIVTPKQQRALRVLLVLILPFGIFFGGIGYTQLRRRMG